jgi:hypothetical protein
MFPLADMVAISEKMKDVKHKVQSIYLLVGVGDAIHHIFHHLF